MIDITLTIDIHAMDRPEDIRYCNSWLKNKNIPATFLIPTALLDTPHLAPCLKELDNGLHEIGTHAHHHSDEEKYLLQKGSKDSLGFLVESHKRFIDFFGYPPKSFRSPTWCYVNQQAFEILHELGYQIDASATPQRLGIFSPYPKQNPWLKTKRQPFFIYKNLLEIPTSCLIFPLGSPSFHTFRKWGSSLFLKTFIWEAQILHNPVINLMLHADDFVPTGPSQPKSPKRLSDLIPRTPGGILAKHWIRETDRYKISQITYGLINQLHGHSFNTLSSLYDKVCPK